MVLVRPTTKSAKQRKISVPNVDAGEVLERGVFLPWSSDVQATWVYYECAVGVMLDSGLVVHNRLPQVDNDADTLASCKLDDPNLDKLTGFGVNLKCKDQYEDILQRMGHARYWFRLWGQALRVGHKVPIPGITTIGGVKAIPYDKNPQWAFNVIAPGGNFGGVILWHAAWSLWYTTLKPPTSQTIPTANPSAHIKADAKLPAGIQAPFSQKDDNAVSASAPKAPNAPLFPQQGQVRQ